MKFRNMKKLFEDMHRHVTRTGDSVILADNPRVFPPLLGWTSVRRGPDDEILEPSVPATWMISIGDAKKSTPFFDVPFAKDRQKVTEEVLRRHCARCHLYVPPETEHGDEECAIREVMLE